LREVSFPSSLTCIGSSAFDWAGLEHVVLPSSVVSVGSYAFEANDYLKSVSSYGLSTAFGEYAFAWCPSLESAFISSEMEFNGI